MKLTVNIAGRDTRRLTERVEQLVRDRRLPPPPRAEDEQPPSPPPRTPNPGS